MAGSVHSITSGPHRLVLIGPPASGKGTQGRRLSERLGLPYLSTGALLREHVEQQSAVGRLAKPILDRGGYLPDELMCQMVGEWLERADNGWVLDGFPRSVPQAEFLDQRLQQDGASVAAAISLEAPFEVLRGRIHGRVECPECRWSGQESDASNQVCPQCGAAVEARADDSVENFTSRHDAYCRSTLPLVGYYRDRGVLYSCDATASRDQVTSQLLDHLAPVSRGV